MVVNSAFVGVTDSEFEREIALNDTKHDRIYGYITPWWFTITVQGLMVHFDKVRTYTS
jgi:hypothetical protein